VAQRQLDRLQRGVGRDHDDLDGRVLVLDTPQHLQTVHLGHLDVHDHEVGTELADLAKGRGGAVRGLDLVGHLQQHP
jgi:hypothetical protein